MKRSQIPNPFELENLEPRIMLSGDPLVGMVDSIAPDELDSLDTGLEIPPLEEKFNSGEDDSQNPAYKQSLQYKPSQNLAGIFSGLIEEDPLADQTGDDATNTDHTETLSDHIITEGEKAAVIQGMEELENLGRLLEDFDAFGAPLPLIDATLGKLLRPYEVLDSRLSTPVYDYFSDATDPPTTDGLLATLQNIPSTTDLVVTADAVNGGYDAVSDEIRFDMDFRATREGEVYLHAGPLVEELGFEFEEDTQSGYVAGITFDFTFGVDLEGGRNEFFLEVHELVADLDISISALNCDVGLETAQGFTEVVNGVVDLDAEVSVQFDETIAGDGRITLTELRSIKSETIDDLVHLVSTGTLFAELPLEGTQGDSGNHTTYIYARSENLFAGTSPDISVRTDISTLKDPILDLLKEFKDIGKNITSFEQLNVILPVIDSSINQLLSENADSGFDNSLDLYTPALEYFTLLEAFNFDVNDYLPRIGALPGIDTPDFDVLQDDHRLKLKNLIEKEYNLQLDQDWNLSLYLPEIWSLFSSDFQIDEYLPKFQLLLGLPYVPRMDEVRSDMKSIFGSLPSLKGLLEYIRTTSRKSLINGFSGQLSSEPFLPDGNRESFQAVQVNETVDASGLNVERLPDQKPWFPEDRSDFDTRAERIFHGLDPPTEVDPSIPRDAPILQPDIHEIVFVDPRVPEVQTLINPILTTQPDNNPSIEILILDPDTNGIEQISEALASFNNLSAIHIISHGSPGSLELGTTRLDSITLNYYAARLETWGDSLVANGDILLYGCNIAKGEVGIEFVERLNKLTDADVAASTNSTGETALGGDWKLEYNTGAIEVQALYTAPELSSYGSLLNGSKTFEEVATDLFDKTVNTATIVTHGFQLSDDGGNSLYDLAEAIRIRIDSANDDDPVWFLDYDVLEDGQTGIFDEDNSTLPDEMSNSGDLVLLFDWAPESNEYSAGWGGAAGEALFTMIVGLAISCQD
ncbi:DUF4347 domain-containing protein [Thermodesulfobacteriota bacterium]